jgi:hypothetical protein
MIGRFLGADVPAAGFSLGFERLVDLVERPGDENGEGVVLLYDGSLVRHRFGRLRGCVRAGLPHVGVILAPSGGDACGESRITFSRGD